MTRLFAVLAACGLVGSCAANAAGIKFPTKYTHYLVSGSSAGEVYKSLARKGPVFNGMRAYASTAISHPKQTRLVVSDGKMCKVRNFSFNTSFVINLPQLKNPGALHGSDLRSWHTFYSFAKHHEEEHRSIWLSCWNALDAQATAQRANTCPELNRKIDTLIKSALSSCEKRHEALDRRDQVALRKQPFIRQSVAQLAN